MIHPASHLEPNELDTIYKVLKKANEMKKEKEKSEEMNAAMSGRDRDRETGTINSNLPQMDIPVVNVPDYPDRIITPRRGPFKSQGPNIQQPQNKQGLTAPMADMSSSGPHTSLYFHNNFFKNTKQNVRKKSCYFFSRNAETHHKFISPQFLLYSSSFFRKNKQIFPSKNIKEFYFTHLKSQMECENEIILKRAHFWLLLFGG